MIHPKKGSPSGRNAYPVIEKMEELKEEEKNDMAKKKTFEEYTQEALYEIEKTEAALKQAKLEKEQYASIYCKAATGCRLHNVYGPNPRKRTLLWFLIEKENVSLYNCGQNIRCFTYIDDVVEGLIPYMEVVFSGFAVDNLEQSVNRGIYLVPLSYTPVEDGVKKVFAVRREDNSQKNAGAEK